MKSRSNGITLIALIITIIIMLILAGVVITLTIGENGILKKSEIAAEKYENKAAEEENMLARLDDYITNDRENVTIPKEEYEELKKIQPTGIKADIYLTNEATSTSTYSITSMAGFTKTKDSENKIDQYLEYTADGYKVLKSGWYYIVLGSRIQSGGRATAGAIIFRVNSNLMGQTECWANNDYEMDLQNNSFNFYLKEGDLIYFQASGTNDCRSRKNIGTIYPIF